MISGLSGRSVLPIDMSTIRSQGQTSLARSRRLRKWTRPAASLTCPLGQPTSGPIKLIPISQDAFETLLREPLNIAWPPVHSGNTKGKLTMYVSVDRDGQIREA